VKDITPPIPDVRPFHHVPGRNYRGDEGEPVDIAWAYYNQRFTLAEDRGVLEKLIQSIGWQNDLAPRQWAQWYAVVLEYKPELVVELGRGFGNSTALFCQALRRLGAGEIISFCLSREWETRSRPKLEKWVSPDWFNRLHVSRENILKVDFTRVFEGYKRALVLWDAHGFEIAEVVLGIILPLLLNTEHLILIHDISDNRYNPTASRSYGENPLWKGSLWQEKTKQWNGRVNIGWMNSIQDQVIALSDFLSRNDLDLGSSDQEYHTFFTKYPERNQEMVNLIGQDMFSLVGDWAFLTLNGKQGPFYFPPGPSPETLAQKATFNFRARLKRGLRRLIDSGL